MFKCLPFVKPCGKQVDHIDRRHAKLEHVPDEVMRNFRTLEECRLDANQIKELPKVIIFDRPWFILLEFLPTGAHSLPHPERQRYNGNSSRCWKVFSFD
ncbi:protein lap4 [Clonorchis sinensis]|uniref:Protein lap4 n=1 Tax=Clonorchis sinensis TaxID=79923 RepID=G7YSS0_CLOSI|nr:protein lap4 [Clonorchis sinensis]